MKTKFSQQTIIKPWMVWVPTWILILHYPYYGYFLLAVGLSSLFLSFVTYTEESMIRVMTSTFYSFYAIILLFCLLIVILIVILPMSVMFPNSKYITKLDIFIKERKMTPWQKKVCAELRRCDLHLHQRLAK